MFAPLNLVTAQDSDDDNHKSVVKLKSDVDTQDLKPNFTPKGNLYISNYNHKYRVKLEMLNNYQDLKPKFDPVEYVFFGDDKSSVKLEMVDHQDQNSSPVGCRKLVIADDDDKFRAKDEINMRTIRKYRCRHCTRWFLTPYALGGHQNAHPFENSKSKRDYYLSPPRRSQSTAESQQPSMPSNSTYKFYQLVFDGKRYKRVVFHGVPLGIAYIKQPEVEDTESSSETPAVAKDYDDDDNKDEIDVDLHL